MNAFRLGLRVPDSLHLQMPLSISSLSYSYQTDGSGIGTSTAAVVFMIDTAVEPDELRLQKKALRGAIASMAAETFVGLVETRRSSVGFYDVSRPLHEWNSDSACSASLWVNVCTMVPISGAALGAPSTTKRSRADKDADLDALLRTSLAFRRIMQPLRDCKQRLLSVVRSLRCCKQFTKRGMRESSLGGSLDVLVRVLPPSRTCDGGPYARRREADTIGPATRVVCCLGGASTVGLGSFVDDDGDTDELTVAARANDAYASMKELGRSLRTAGMIVDVLVGGQRAVDVASVLCVTKPTGGSVVLHENFGSRFASNLATVVAAVENCGKTSIEVTVRGPIRVSEWLGPVYPGTSRTRTGSLVGTSWTSSSIDAVSSLSNVRGSHHVGIVLDVGAAEAPVDIQVTVSHEGKDRSRCTVHTCRAVRRGEAAAVIGNIYQGVSAALLAKRMIARVLSEMDRGPDEDLHERLLDIRHALGKAAFDTAEALCSNSSRSLGGSKMPTLDARLMPLARRLYFMCHGSLFGDILYHQDEKYALWSQFLNGAPEFCERVLAPRLLSFPSGSRNCEDVPPVSLALDSDSVLLMDCGTHLLLWIGASVQESDEALQAAAKRARVIETSRFPVPLVIMSREGTSSSRYMLARLIPIHQDSREEQVTQLPVLGGMSAGDIDIIQSRLLMTDVPSLFQWLRRSSIQVPVARGVRIKEEAERGGAVPSQFCVGRPEL